MNTRPEMVHQTREFESQTPMQRMAKVEEMAGPALFLASDAASFCTGVDRWSTAGLSAGDPLLLQGATLRRPLHPAVNPADTVETPAAPPFSASARICGNAAADTTAGIINWIRTRPPCW